MKWRPAKPNVVVVDDFFESPDEIRALGMKQTFQYQRQYHKGQRSTERFLWPGLKEEFERLLNRQITRWEEQANNGVFQLCVAGEQIVYHSDEQTHAAVVYLTPDAPPESGTTLVRSKLLKARYPEEVRRFQPEYPGNIIKDMYENKILDKTAWEPVDVIGNVYNRLVLWNARLVHHASAYFGHDMPTGRFFQMFFFDAL